jgi:hypothetical protein
MSTSEENSDSFELSVQKDGLSVGTKGGAATRLANVVADLASPFSEGFGALGDVIHYYRQDMAIRSLKRAKELAILAEINVKPVPPKFLVDWVEKASLEMPEDNDLTNMWAALLLTAGETKSSTVYHFKRILSELTARHVQFLSILCQHEFGGNEPYTPQSDFSKWNSFRNQDYKQKVEITSPEEYVNSSISECQNNRLSILGFYVRSTRNFGLDPQESFQRKKNIYVEFENEFIIKYFLDTGIIEKIEISIGINMDGLDPTLSHYLCVDALYLTNFGVEFISSCQPKKNTAGAVA